MLLQNLKRKEREFEMEFHKIANQKIVMQERISNLKTDLRKMDIDLDINAITMATHDSDNDSTSTSTATGGRDTYRQIFYSTGIVKRK